MDDTEATLNAGDVCLDCQQKGLEKYLRYFKVNLHGDTILKCESNQCMYPYNDEFSSSDDEDKCPNNNSQTNSLKLINDLIQQFDYDDSVEDPLSHAPIIESASEQVAQFDITFLDDFKVENNENMCETESIEDKKQYISLTEAKPIKYDSMKCEISNAGFQQPEINFCDVALQMPANDKVIDIKQKIKIQSVETLKIESPLYHELPTSSKNFRISSENLATNLYTSLAAEDQKKNELKVNKINKSQTKALNSPKPSTATLSVAIKKSPKKSQTFDIPKAEILKANAVLKKFATIEENEQFPKYNRKYKKVRKKDCQKSANIEKSNISEPSTSLKTDVDYSLDKITQLLLAKK